MFTSCPDTSMAIHTRLLQGGDTTVAKMAFEVFKEGPGMIR